MAIGNPPVTQVMTGPKAIFRIDGKQIAYASGVSYTEEVQLEEVNVLDEIAVKEHAEVGYRCTLQCNTFRVLNNSVKQLGLMSRLEDILTQGVLTADIFETNNPDGPPILVMLEVKIESRQTTLDARGVMTETWNFRGTKASDEAL